MHSYKVETRDQLNLHVTHWYKIENSKGTLCIIHGLGEHQERYAHVAKFYSEHGFNVFITTKEVMVNQREKEDIL